MKWICNILFNCHWVSIFLTAADNLFYWIVLRCLKLNTGKLV